METTRLAPVRPLQPTRLAGREADPEPIAQTQPPAGGMSRLPVPPGGVSEDRHFRGVLPLERIGLATGGIGIERRQPRQLQRGVSSWSSALRARGSSSVGMTRLALRWNYRGSYSLPPDDAIEVAKDEQS